jgi:hypothetical protein
MSDQDLNAIAAINSELAELCKWVNKRRDIATAAKLIPITDRLTRLLIEIRERQ